MTPQLSICILTYNRAPYLRSLLQCIMRQFTDDIPPGTVEIYVRNNASTDDTAAVLAEYAALLPDLRHTTLAVNEGFDRNCFSIVREARGTFCWLMGDDDLPAPGGIATVLRDIQMPGFDLILYDRIECDEHSMAVIRTRRWTSAAGDIQVAGGSPDSLRDYLRKTVWLGGIFSFISSLVVRRECWKLPDVPDIFASGYVHVFCCWQVLANGGRMIARRETPVLCRLADDIIRTGALNRFLLDQRGFGTLAHFADRTTPGIGLEILRTLRRCSSFSMLLKAAVMARQENRSAELRHWLRACGYPALVLWSTEHPHLPLLFHPAWLAILAPCRRLADRFSLRRGQITVAPPKPRKPEELS